MARTIPVLTTSAGYFLLIRILANSTKRFLRINLSETIMQILRAKENGMFILVCLGWHDLKLRYCLESVCDNFSSLFYNQNKICFREVSIF